MISVFRYIYCDILKYSNMERVTSTVFADYIADHILTLDPCKTDKGTGWADRYTHQVKAERYYNQSETIYEIAKE